MKIGNFLLLFTCVAMTGLPACGSDDEGGGGKPGTGGAGTGGSGATGGSTGGSGGSGATGGSGGSTGGSGGSSGSSTGGTAGSSTGGAAGAAGGCATGTGAEVVDCASGTPAATVTIADFSFSPASTSVAVGDIVKFDNTGAFTHTATSGTPTCLDGNFDTGNIAKATAKCVKFNVAGDYPFFCMVHNSMTGTITVN